MSLAENLIADKLYRLKLSKAQLATLTGIANQRLIPGLRGVVKLSNEEFERIYQRLDDVEKLTEIVKPFALPVDVSEIKSLLGRMRRGDFETDKYRRLLEAATALAIEVSHARPNPFPGDPLDEALNQLDAVVKTNEGIEQEAFYFLGSDPVAR